MRRSYRWINTQYTDLHKHRCAYTQTHRTHHTTQCCVGFELLCVCLCGVYARLRLWKCVYCVFIHLLLLLILHKVSCYHDNCVHGDLRVSGRKCLPRRLSSTRNRDELQLLYLLPARPLTHSTLSTPRHNLAVLMHKYVLCVWMHVCTPMYVNLFLNAYWMCVHVRETLWLFKGCWC